MVVTRLLGMRIPVSPVSKRNPALSASCTSASQMFRGCWALPGRTAEGGCPYIFRQTNGMKKSIGVSPNIETLFGTRDENVRLLEDGLNVTINLRSNAIELEGADKDVARAAQVFADYESLLKSGHTFNNGDLNSMLRVLTSRSEE